MSWTWTASPSSSGPPRSEPRTRSAGCTPSTSTTPERSHSDEPVRDKPVPDEAVPDKPVRDDERTHPLSGTGPDLLTRSRLGRIVTVSLGAVTFHTDPAGFSTRALLDREQGRRLLCLDPNVRPTVIDDLAAYGRVIDQVVTGIDLVKVSDEDLALLHPDRDVPDVAADWAASGPALVVVTRGPHGCVAFTADGSRTEVPGQDIEVVDTVGAGDAFTSGLLAALESQDALTHAGLEALQVGDLENALRYAITVAAVTCTRPGADPPSAAEMLDGLAGGADRAGRAFRAGRADPA